MTTVVVEQAAATQPISIRGESLTGGFRAPYYLYRRTETSDRGGRDNSSRMGDGRVRPATSPPLPNLFPPCPI